MNTEGNSNIQIHVGRMDVFNYALYQNGVSPIRDVEILNTSMDPMDGLTLRITSDLKIFHEREAMLPAIPAGKPVRLPDIDLEVDGKALAELTEAVIAHLTIAVEREQDIVAEYADQMKVLAYDEWPGQIYADTLASFVMPNHPVIPALMHDAAQRLQQWGKNPSLEGYQSGDPNRVRDLAAAAYAAIQKKNIVYAEPPASFEMGQRVRTPDVIMEQRLGTCMDMTLLYASLLEAMGLHPILTLMEGHIFAGVWLVEKSYKDIVVNDLQELTKRFGNKSDELTFVECTAMCSGKGVDYEQAEQSGKIKLRDPSQFRYAIDVSMARRHGIKPLASRIVRDGSYQIDITEKSEEEMSRAPKALDISVQEVTAQPKKIMTKQGLWESKLLDLSQHNMLLSLPHNASIQPIMSSHIDELEDALADGEEFRLQALPDFIIGLMVTEQKSNGKQGKSKPWLVVQLEEYGVFEMTHWEAGPYDFNSKLRSEYRSHRLYTYRTPKDLDKDLTSIYRAARASQQENGVSSLYLAIGLLRWFDTGADKPCYAPLVLLPVEIIRKSANQGYALHMRDEEPHFNTTLLEMLRQNYGIDIGGVDPLPGDEHGIDIRKVFAIVRSAVFSLPYWDVVETCVIGNFSFAQFAMWNDIHGAEQWLTGSKIVRSLMKGYVDYDATLPADVGSDQVYLPITVDATQLQAIKMAAHGTTFVLHGPPGTGKSQTITGMIANLMAQGKTVLFVAEKMAALSVVQKRLSALGIGDFCLELHSDKASKKQVLTQLSKALEAKRDDSVDEYEEILAQMLRSRSHLDDYKDHLHQVRNCGYSLRELIDLYEGVRDNSQAILFDPYAVGNITRGMIRQHVPFIGQLVAAGSSFANIASSPLQPIELDAYTTDVRAGLRTLPRDYRSQLTKVQGSGAALAELLGVSGPVTSDDYSALDNLVSSMQDPDTLQKYQMVLDSDERELRQYYAANEALVKERERLLASWQQAFLSMDMASVRERYDAAGKRFFGKSSALEAVRSDVQSYAHGRVETEQIPAYLRTIETYQQQERDVASMRNQLSGNAFATVDACSDWSAYEEMRNKARALDEKVAAVPGGLRTLAIVSAQKGSRQQLQEYHQLYIQCQETGQKLNALIARTAPDEGDWIASELALCDTLENHADELKEWTLYNKARSACRAAGLQPVIDAYEQGMAADDIVPAYHKGLYSELIGSIISTDDVLAGFSGATFNESIQQFKRIDDLLLQQTKSQIYNLLVSRVPTAWDSPEMGLEVGLLRKAIGSNARGISIRTLFERISHVVQRLSPCMLMSPNSVAQYLAQNNELFDVVIFDEASQLPTCKAVGALARARNAVIVGDPKQMPPTSFFAGSGPQVDDLALDDLDSILDDALALGIPSQYLQWHYRSTHESLIAFSNHEFYDNKMYTFPSANDRERHVSAIYTAGIYSKGVNPKEAESVVAEIIRRYHDPALSRQSIGVVTFNVKQQALIEDLLNKQFQQDPAMDAWANGGEDPLFVKNLENVQGDERDVILFSIGYGPDEKGHLSMNFGPINRQGGGKRLNVAFSRARITMTIFTSLYSSQIVITESSPDGLKAFRDFLRFAEGHDISAVHDMSDDTMRRDGILQSIVSAIQEHGYQCVPMIGHSDFHVDLAIVDPINQDQYLMGIMLDGEGYRRTENARDREVAQIGVLQHLGWHLHRVWTIDWWDHRDKELRRIITMLDELRVQSEQRAKERADQQVQEKATAAIDTEALSKELAAQTAEVMAEEQEAGESTNISEVAVAIDVPIEATKEIEIVDEPADLGGSNQDEEDVPDEKEISAESVNKVTAEDTADDDATEESGSDDVPHEDKAPEAEGDSTQSQTPLSPAAYVFAELPELKLSAEQYVSAGNKDEIRRRAEEIIRVEAPILRDTLIKRILSSCGTSKTNGTIEATEKAIKAAKARNVKYKGVVFCWAPDQDPKTYTGIRVTAERSGEEIAPQEITNALCLCLQQNGPMDKDDLIKATSRILGYSRLGKNIEAALNNGLAYARTNGAICVGTGKKMELKRDSAE